MGKAWDGASVVDLIAGVYAASVDAGGWPGVLRTIGEVLEAATVGIHRHPQDGEVVTLSLHGEPPGPLLGRIERAARYVPEEVLTGKDLGADRILLLGVLASSPSPLCYLLALRPDEAEPFGEVERRRLERLTPHLTRAIGIRAQLDAASEEERLTSRVLDQIASGIVLVDARRRVLRMNEAARRIVESQDPLRLDRDVLSASDPKNEADLDRLVRGSTQTCTLMRAPLGRPLVVRRRPAEGAIVIFLEEPLGLPAINLDGFSRSHRLSPAEMLLAQYLLDGRTLRQAATKMRIQESTARSHLKRVFAKTGASRQSDLILRILAHAPGGTG